MKAHYLRLFAYEAWANAKILKALEQLPEMDMRCLELFSHLITAQAVWFTRVQRNQQYLPLWEIHSLEKCKQDLLKNQNDWMEYLQNTTDESYEQFIAYKNTQGEDFTTALKDILTHLINHATYHRGQIVAQMKGKIPELPSTDFIFFTREK